MLYQDVENINSVDIFEHRWCLKMKDELESVKRWIDQFNTPNYLIYHRSRIATTPVLAYACEEKLNHNACLLLKYRYASIPGFLFFPPSGTKSNILFCLDRIICAIIDEDIRN